MISLRYALFLAALGVAVPASAEITELPATLDTTLMEDSGAISNGAGPVFFVGATNQGSPRRALIKFDLSPLPEGAMINSVTLRLVVDRSRNPTGFDVDVHTVDDAWGEGKSSSSLGTGDAATDGDATWTHRVFPDITWSTSGGDFDGTASATFTVAGPDVYMWTDPGLAADVMNWLDNPATNHGWILIGDEAASASARRFHSRESASADDQPRLIVDHSGGTPVQSTTWSSIKRLY